MAGNHNYRSEKSPVAFDTGCVAAKEEVCILYRVNGVVLLADVPHEQYH